MQEYNSINDGDLNPQVQLELEKLNSSSAQINELENKLQEFRNSYYETLSKCTIHLSELGNKIGNNVISKVRPYFNLKRQQIEVQKESQIAATRYEAACVQLSHADAVVSKNETLCKESPKLDDSTMEILNIAISKVNLSKIRKTEAHNEHQFYLNKYREIDEKIHQWEKKYKSDIRKAKQYFNYSKDMDEQLKENKLNIDVYEDKVRICKLLYNESLQRLEDISNDIHMNREKNHLLGPRGEGVGAENELFQQFENDSTSQNNKEHFENKLISNTPSLEKTISKSSKPPICNGKRKKFLTACTPIVDGLLEAISSNYSTSHFLQNDNHARSFYQIDSHNVKSEIHLDTFNYLIDYVDVNHGNHSDEI